MSQTAEVHLTKQAIVERLLRSAIRSWAREDDPIATFLVASTCHRLLYDLHLKQGNEPISRYLAVGIWDVATKTMTEGSYSGPTELQSVVSQLVEAIEEGRVVSWENLEIEISPSQLAELLRSQRKAYNFVKHADRDHLASISSGDFDCQKELQMCSALYMQLFPVWDNEELDLFRYHMQRESGKDYTPDLLLLAKTFDNVPQVEVRSAIHSYLTFADQHPLEEF